MSPFSRQSTLFLQSRLTEEFHSESLWTDDSTSSAFREGTSHFFGGTSTTFDDPPAFSTINLLPSFEDDRLGPLSAPSEDLDHTNYVGATNGYNVPFSIQPEDLYVTSALSLYSLTAADRTPISRCVVSVPCIKPLTLSRTMNPVCQRKQQGCMELFSQCRSNLTSP